MFTFRNESLGICGFGFRSADCGCRKRILGTRNTDLGFRNADLGKKALKSHIIEGPLPVRTRTWHFVVVPAGVKVGV